MGKIKRWNINRKKLLKSFVNSKRLYIFAHESDISDVIDMLKAKHRASFSPNGNLRNSSSSARTKHEGGECCAVVSALYRRGLLSYSTFKVFSGPPLQNIGAKSAPFDTIELKTIINMLHFKGKATFKCKQCGHKFEAFDTEGGIIAGPNLPHCPKCGSCDTRKVSFFSRFRLFTILLFTSMAFSLFAQTRNTVPASSSQMISFGSELLRIKTAKNTIDNSRIDQVVQRPFFGNPHGDYYGVLQFAFKKVITLEAKNALKLGLTIKPCLGIMGLFSFKDNINIALSYFYED